MSCNVNTETISMNSLSFVTLKSTDLLCTSNGSFIAWCIGYLGLHRWLRLERIHLQCGRLGFDPWLWKISPRREWQSTQVSCPGESLWTEEPGRPQSKGLQRAGHDWTTFTSLSLVILEDILSLWVLYTFQILTHFIKPYFKKSH